MPNDRQHTCSSAVSVVKAFDTVDHELLVDKLNSVQKEILLICNSL